MRTLLLLSTVLLLTGCSTANTPVEPDSSSSSTSSVATSSTSSSVRSVNTTGMNLAVPAGFTIDTFAENLPGARVIVKDGLGGYWISQPDRGVITILEMSGGIVRNQYESGVRGLDKPHGLAVDENGLDLYIATETKLMKARMYSDAPVETIATWNGGGRHTSRTVGIGPDDRLYISIGSSCDVCIEDNEERGTIISMKKDGSDRKIVAHGLRNSVFFTWRGNELWATDMGRDMLGDNLPSDEVNVVHEGEHYGWPFCYDDNVRDLSFQKNTQFDCSIAEPPRVKLGAHIAPLGIAFIPNTWPSEYRGDLLVAEHGSWNSSVKVGYKIVRVPIGANGLPEGPPVDFLTGFLSSNGTVIGRPVDLVFDGNDLLITDDKTGKVYRMRPL